MTTLPTIHLNGSGAENLCEEYTAALNALQYAREALVHATLNMRDFYPQGDGAYAMAREERTNAFLKLQEVEEYLAAWVIHCHEHLARRNAA